MREIKFWVWDYDQKNIIDDTIKIKDNKWD